MTKRFKLSPYEHERVYKCLEEEMLSSSSPSDVPRIAIIGGQPGAGKSFLAKRANALSFENKSIAVINGDNYRYEHPHAIEILMTDDKKFAENTDPDVRIWTRRLLDAAIKNRRDILFEGTMRSKEPLMSTIQRLHDDKYRTDVFVLAVPAPISRLGIIDRYERDKARFGYARWTPIDSHDEAYRNLPETVAAIEAESPADSLSVYNRQGELLYRVDRGKPSDVEQRSFASAVEALSKERDRELSKYERQVQDEAIAAIFNHMKLRLASDREIALVQRFCSSGDVH